MTRIRRVVLTEYDPRDICKLTIKMQQQQQQQQAAAAADNRACAGETKIRITRGDDVNTGINF